MRATIHAMNIFVRAVEGNSFAAVARSLFIDPGAVSRTIKSLETELGVLLFARSTRSLKLTPEGERFYRDSVAILKRFEAATQQFRNYEAEKRGRLTVGLAPAMSRRTVLSVMPTFMQHYPKIEIVVVNVDEHADFGEKGVDVLLRGGSQRKRGKVQRDPQGLVVSRLIQSPMIACASPEYLDRVGVPSVPTDLSRHACICHLNLQREILNEWRFVKPPLRQQVKLVPRLVVQGAEALIEAAVAGCGIVRVMPFDIEDELRSQKLVRVLPEWDSAAVRRVAVYRKTQPMPLQISAFVQHLKEAFRHYTTSIAEVPQESPTTRQLSTCSRHYAQISISSAAPTFSRPQ
jgi:DNA-binding transcriptional LysR family regulator